MHYVWLLLCGMAGPSSRLPGLYVLYLADYLYCVCVMSGRLHGLCVSYVWQMTWTVCALCLVLAMWDGWFQCQI